MNSMQALLLGTVQGVTEFLPISSSGHLVLLQHYFGITDPMVFFDVLVHVGTLAAVVIFLRRELAQIAVSLARGHRSSNRDAAAGRRMLLLIVVGLVPTALVGAALLMIKQLLFSSVVLPAIMLIATGVLLFLTGRPAIQRKQRQATPLKWRQAFLIGLAQGIAIIPGISRSGATIATGLLQGIERETAFRYSFLLFIPAILAALVVEVREASLTCSLTLSAGLIGTVAAFVTGLLALFALKRVLKSGKLAVFAWYCWILGGLVLISRALQLGL